MKPQDRTERTSCHADTRFAQFADGLAEAVQRIGDDGFPAALDDAIRCLVPFDNSMVFAYAPRKQPIGVCTDLASDSETAIIVDAYILGPYLLDPFYEEVRRGRRAGLAHLGDIAPDEFTETEYFERHYRRTRITDEVGFFMGLSDDVTAVLSITRRHGGKGFSPAEIATLRDISGVVCALGLRHWSDLPLRFLDAGAQPHGIAAGPVEEALRHLRRDTLSDRQAEIVEFLLKGHSTASIALHLDISAETVKVHRRNAYAKLGISSQAELFSIFIEQLSSMIGVRG
ncbi:helix-turn-helix transcriptional regulator [Roseovarius salis]|uniref:helix-turn-helix transcriptional regulator n=1 Tax=Roseovarius salis TaxID=3376063 RepID=UPI0037C8EF8A